VDRRGRQTDTIVVLWALAGVLSFVVALIAKLGR